MFGNISRSAFAAECYADVGGHAERRHTSRQHRVESLISAGRASLFSSYNKNSFDNFSAEPVEGIDTYVTRFDETDSCFTFEGSWEHNLMSSFKNYKRTISDGTEGDSFTVSFEGTGFALSGETREKAILGVSIDGGDEQLVTVSRTGQREISCHFEGLSEGAHAAKVTIKSGKYFYKKPYFFTNRLQSEQDYSIIDLKKRAVKTASQNYRRKIT